MSERRTASLVSWRSACFKAVADGTSYSKGQCGEYSRDREQLTICSTMPVLINSMTQERRISYTALAEGSPMNCTMSARSIKASSAQ